MIARTWRGATRAEDAVDYARYVQRTGLRAYSQTTGNRGAYLLMRDGGDGRARFLTVSLWDSVEAVRAFAGEDIRNAVFYPSDSAWLVEADPVADHWAVTEPNEDIR